MTVEDLKRTTGEELVEDCRTGVKSLRDVTGICDEEELLRALDKSKDHSGTPNLDRAIELLLERSDTSGGRVEESRMAPAVVMNPPPHQQQRQVVDLTEDKDDLRRAIALSLAEGSSTSSSASTRPPGVSQEDQDVSKALEASLMESVNSQRTSDGHNPHDRKRDGDWPVGLKNVGQTCWFSAVIQSFFHLPAFRRLVLTFNPPQREPKSEKERKILDFMLELRKLFSLLVGSQRKYVDPSIAVGILRGSLGGENNYCNNQQDVSEFTHKLLDWLEEAFKIRDKCSGVKAEEGKESMEAMDSDTEKCDKEKEVGVEDIKGESSTLIAGRNPMYDLFYGRVKIEGKNQGIEFSREEQFGQWPLQVNNYSDIHDSLEASTAHEFIDTSSQSDLQGSVVKSGQERWFTQLPPVLFLELSRFQYNQERGMAEKINNFLDFPDVIFMDRYLEANKNITRSKREEVKKLKEQREGLKTRLQSYLEYGNDHATKIPLVSILNRTMQFARGGPESHEDQAAGLKDSEMSSPNSNTLMQVDSPCPSPASLTPASSMVNLATAGAKQEKSPLKTLPDGSVQIPIKMETVEKNTPTPMEVELESDDAKTLSPDSSCPQQPLVPGQPVPRYVSELELKVLSACLTRWRQEVEEDLAALNGALEEVETKIKDMYETPSLSNNGYRLHAVMVHEGDVNQGHYWAYVYHPGRKVWLKFNDNSVSESSWVCMKKESAGGRMSTSAYSMVYIDAKRPDLLAIFDEQMVEAGSVTRERLPVDLETYIEEDIKQFDADLLNWDQQLLKNQMIGPMPEPASSNDDVLIGDDPECQIIESKSDLSNSHAMLAEESTIRAMKLLNSTGISPRKPGNNNLSVLVNKLFQEANTKKDNDCKLDSFLQYLMSAGVDNLLLKQALLEQISLPTLDTSSEIVRNVVQEARESLRTFDQADLMISWHKAYHNFRIACYYFVLGVDRYNENKVEDSVQLLTTSYIVNKKIIDDPPQCKQLETKCMSTRGLIKYFHLAVESLNSQLVEHFEAGDNPAEVFSRVNKVLVPAIQILQERTNNAALPNNNNRDAGLLETVRGRWCALLETQMPTEKYDYWSRIFNTVVADDNSVILKRTMVPRYPKLAEDLKLAARFRSIMQTVLNENN